MKKIRNDDRRRIVLVLLCAILVWCVLVWSVAERRYDTRTAALIEQKIQLSRERANHLADSMGRSLQHLRGIPDLLVYSQQVQAAARSRIIVAETVAERQSVWTRDPLLGGLSRYLEVAGKSLSADLVYVLDARGNCIAASNWNSPISLVGNNYAEREYFRQASQGGKGAQYAVGKTTRIPGLYFSTPITVDGKFMGAVVAKVDLPNLYFLVKQTDSFVTDVNDVVILSYDKSMELHSLPGAAAASLSQDAMLEFYKTRELPVLQMEQWDAQMFPSLFRLHGKDVPHVLTTVELAEYGFNIFVGDELPTLDELAHERWALTLLASLLGSVLILSAGGTVIYLRNIKQAKGRLQMLSVAIEQSPTSVVITDSQARIEYVNPRFTEVSGYTQEDVIGRNPRVLNSGLTDASVYPVLWDKLVNGEPWSGQFVNRRKNGDIYLEEAYIAPVKDAAGRTTHYVAVKLDVTERKRIDERLQLTAKVFENTLEGIIITDAAMNIVEVNDAFTSITGYARDEAIGKTPRMLQSGLQSPSFYRDMWQGIASLGHWRGEVWNRNKQGEVFAELLNISAVTNDRGEVTNYVAVFSDITLLKQHEKQLEHVAHYDPLTGLPNRLLLADRMRQALAHAKRNKTLLAVCFIDLDGFKNVNDSMGHEAGDKVLIEVTRRFSQMLRADDTVARMGGDEFVVLLEGLEAAEECLGSLNRLLESVAQQMDIDGKTFFLGASIGVSLYHGDDQDADTLLRHADQAMYIAKQSGKNRYHLYDVEHDQRARTHHEFLARIASGLADNEFELYYQPKVEMTTRKLSGAEALIRWNHPERGLLAPGDFLRAIEGTELEIELGEWVMQAALEQLERWRLIGLELELSINISASHLQNSDFVWKLKRKLLRYPELPAESLQIEVLETAALDDIAKVGKIIEACHKIGVSFALDDFGTGYSSLSYLSHLPVDALKIDQSFVRDMLVDKGDHAIVQGVIALADAFERKTVAEGVETEAHFQALLAMGCQYGQGYGIARPMPEAALLRWWQDNRRS
ncbi:MAG: EAL domain-containing protein [Gallionella sp.]|nr:EAL domain-containing protein [Gallionella sp.]